MNLDGARVLVTGASGGIGSAVAEQLMSKGAQPLLHGRDPVRLQALSERLGAPSVVADFAEVEAPAKLAALAGPVDVLVHCAGVGLQQPVVGMAEGDIERLVRTNLSAPVELTRNVLIGMVDQGAGHIAFVGSIAGFTGVAGEAVYSATKAGLVTFADALQLELRKSGITVSTLSPAAVDTDFWIGRGAPYERSVPKLVTAARVAVLLIRDIERARCRRLTPPWLGLAVAMRAAAPATYQRLAGRLA